MCHERLQYGKRLLDRSVEVNMFFPGGGEGERSLSQQTVLSRSLRVTTECTRSDTETTFTRHNFTIYLSDLAVS
jgi:hypothetical protein